MAEALDSLATGLCVRFDGELKVRLLPAGRGSAPELSDAELATPAVLSALLGCTVERRRHR